jgi:hypothetical protein
VGFGKFARPTGWTCSSLELAEPGPDLKAKSARTSLWDEKLSCGCVLVFQKTGEKVELVERKRCRLHKHR